MSEVMKQKNYSLEHITMKQVLFIIAYTIGLIWIILHMNQVAECIRIILDLLKPFIYGIVMAFLFHLPLQYFLKKIPDSVGKWKQPLAALLSLVLIIGMITFVISIVVPQVVDSVVSLANAFPGYLDSFQDWMNEMMEYQQVSIEVLHSIEKYAGQIEETLMTIVKNGLPQIVSMASGFASGIANFFMAIVIAVYLTVSKKRLQRQLKTILYAFLPKKGYEYALKIGRLANETFTNFVSGQVMEAIIIGVLCFIGCKIFRFPYAPIVSIIIGCTNFIPIFGAIFGVGVSALLVMFVNPVQGVFFVIFGTALQQIESNLIYPKVVGNTVGLSGLWVLFAISVGGGLFGFKGMILGLPVFSILYALIREETYRRIDLKKCDQKKEMKKIA